MADYSQTAVVPNAVPPDMCHTRPSELCVDQNLCSQTGALCGGYEVPRVALGCRSQRLGYLVAVQVVDDVLCLAKVARNLRTARFDSGALRLDNIKLYFALDGDGNPCGATPHVQREANQTIEEFMLLANRSVAKFISDVFPDRCASCGCRRPLRSCLGCRRALATAS